MIIVAALYTLTIKIRLRQSMWEVGPDGVGVTTLLARRVLNDGNTAFGNGHVPVSTWPNNLVGLKWAGIDHLVVTELAAAEGLSIVL